MRLPKDDPEAAERLSGLEGGSGSELYQVLSKRGSYVRELEQMTHALNRQVSNYRQRIRLALEYAPENARRTIAELKAALNEVQK